MYFVFKNGTRITGPQDGETKESVNNLLARIPIEERYYWQVFQRKLVSGGHFHLVPVRISCQPVTKDVLCVV